MASSMSRMGDVEWKRYLKAEHHEVPLIALKGRTLQQLSHGLDLEIMSLDSNLPADYRGLGAMAGINFLRVEHFRRPELEKPTVQIISEWQRNKNCRQKPTLGNLVKALLRLERLDVLADCKQFMAADAEAHQRHEQEELEQLFHRHVQNIPCHQAEVLTKHDLEGNTKVYDAFICVNYDSDDRQFVREMVRKFESPPYNLHLYLPPRDGLLGVPIYATDAKVIENRCSHVIVILSPDYHDCEECIFQANFALGLSLRDPDRHIVPVVIRDCNIPDILRVRSMMEFTQDRDNEENWHHLAASVSSFRPARPLDDD